MTGGLRHCRHNGNPVLNQAGFHRMSGLFVAGRSGHKNPKIIGVPIFHLSNEKIPGCSLRMPVGAHSGVPTYHRYLLFFFFFLIQGAFSWVGVGWGGDVNVPCTCTHVRCYAIGCFLHLHTYLMLRHRMFLVGLRWGGVGMLTFLALAHMFDATP